MSNVKSLAKLPFFSESVRTENHWIVQKHSRSEVLYEKGALRNFSKSTGKHPCQSHFLIKLQAKACKFMKKKRLWRRCFPENFTIFLRTPFLTELLWWLLLIIDFKVS